MPVTPRSVAGVRSTASSRLYLHRVRRFAGRWPLLYQLAVRARGEGEFLVRASSGLVIEGFPRSGNNFAFEAFTQANPGVHVASRTHAPQQVRRGVRLERPVLVLVRRPTDAVLSLCVRQPYLGVRESLHAYVRYHEAIWPLRSAFEVSTFEQVTTDFGSVIDALNDRFGTSFRRYENTAEADRRTLASIERHHLEYVGGHLEEAEVSRPSSARSEQKNRLRSALRSPEVVGGLARAEAIYARFDPSADSSS